MTGVASAHRQAFGKDVVSRCVSENCSFAPLGLAFIPYCTHGLRRGLHSFAASRLQTITPATSLWQHRTATSHWYTAPASAQPQHRPGYRTGNSPWHHRAG